MDRRLASRVDPSDVVQEALADADRDLSAYLRDRPLPFYPWLRGVAWRRLVQQYRHHVVARRRSVNREEPNEPTPDDASAHFLAAAFLAAGGSSPSRAMMREELLDRVHDALTRLHPGDRDLLVMRHLEGMSSVEIGPILGVSEGAVRVRLVRALKRLRVLLEGEGSEARL
jgi:RNA polymerase sigma-70 factor (ECF subfamily)